MPKQKEKENKEKEDKKVKKEEQAQIDPNSQLELAKKAILKKYGKVVGMMGEEKELFIPTISSGSLALDLALGRGGFAFGRIYEFYGPPSGGKTTLAMSVLAQAQKRNMNCLFCDAEHAADPELFKAMGVDIDKLIKVKGYVGDENLDIVETLIKTGAIDVAVIDSVSALIPEAESEAEIGDDFMGLLARLMSKAMRRFSPLAAKTNTLMIFINQLRFKIGSWGDPTTTTGGEALTFYATGRIAVSGGEFKNSRIKDDITGETVGHKTTFEIRKNKLAPPFRTAEIPLIYGVGYDLNHELIELATQLDIINKTGNYFYYKDTKLGQGEGQAKAFLKENATIYNDIRSQIIDITGLKIHYERNS